MEAFLRGLLGWREFFRQLPVGRSLVSNRGSSVSTSGSRSVRASVTHDVSGDAWKIRVGIANKILDALAST
ncbi:hypothetical protein AB0C22_18105 [Micromonospora sp. NPDC048894]|uniref:hypothetical protein n=1 Tax=Micromonospora sp. NPDC048894 TaxID=3155493 RepID=UPI0033D2D316